MGASSVGESTQLSDWKFAQNMSVRSLALFTQDPHFLGITLSAETANAIWIDIVSYGLIWVFSYVLVQIFHMAKVREFQKRLDPIGWCFVIVPTIAFNDDIRTFLFMH